MKIPETNKIISVAMLIGIVVALFIVYKILAATGLLKTASDRKEEAKKEAAVSDLRVDDYFDPLFYKTSGATKILTVDESKVIALKIRGYLAGVGTDEEGIYTIFGSLPNKVSISIIAEAYKDQYGFPFYIMSDDLKKDLLNELSASEVSTLMDIISKLPNL